jgi:hypothetical protein
MLTGAEIEEAKKRTNYSLKSDILHEHNDCIRMAYEWLDAQKKIKGKVAKPIPIKHHIEKWCGRYISTHDVEVAAVLHPEIRGTYPYFNISSRLTLPSRERLQGVSQAFTQDYKLKKPEEVYKHAE